MSRNRRRQLLACFFLIFIVCAAHGSRVALTHSSFADSRPANSATDLGPAMTLLNASRARFKTVRDYSCRLVKRERVNNKMLPESVMTLKVRNQPFSIYLHCESPDEDRGLAVCYVEGKHHGKMRVRPPGIKGILDFWTIDTHDRRALEKNRHCITEAGIGNLLEATARYWEIERRLNKTLVEITDDKIADRACTRIETIHPDRNAGDFYGYRCVLWLDKATLLPVGAETYDWPRDKGQKGGDLLESYRYLDLRTNVDLADETFRH